jgi:hypothetical protein
MNKNGLLIKQIFLSKHTKTIFLLREGGMKSKIEKVRLKKLKVKALLITSYFSPFTIYLVLILPDLP